MELKKKSMYFFKCFPLLEIKEKKNFVGAEPFLGYYPNYIVKKKNIFVLQEYDCIVTARRCS